jgi:hypothetical protein
MSGGVCENCKRDLYGSDCPVCDNGLIGLRLKYVEIEEQIRDGLKSLRNYGKDECDCVEVEPTIMLINKNPEYPEIERFCLTCGALLWDRGW